MANDLNDVVSGMYSGCKVDVDKSRHLAFVRLGGKDFKYITKNHVKDIREIGVGTRQSTMEETAVNTAFFGVAGTASSLRGTPVRLIDITWSYGAHSLVRVDEETAEAITIGMHGNVSASEEEISSGSVQSGDTFEKVVLWIIAGVWLLFLLKIYL